MTHPARPLGVLAASLAGAALWVTVLRPAPSQAGGPVTALRPAPSQAGGPALAPLPITGLTRHHHRANGLSNGPSGSCLAVPPLLVPGSVQYAPQSPTSPIAGPTGERVAQLSSVPATLAQSVGATFPTPSKPINAPSRAPSLPPSADLVGVDFAVLSVVQYQGSGGTVFVSTARPSAGALGHLSCGLGDTAATSSLPDGSTAWAIESKDLTNSPNQVRWLKDGRIVTIAGTLPVDQLRALAANVVVQ